MISFIPYASFRFFGLIALLLAPIITLGLLGRRCQIYNDSVAILMTFLIFAAEPNQLISLIVFILWQALLIRFYLAQRRKTNKILEFYLSVGLSILPLFLVKLSADLPTLSILGFLGISYVTFKSIQILMDIRDGLLKEIPMINFLRFITFFPTISSGPIDRYRRFKKDADHVSTSAEYHRLLEMGLHNVFLGFLYKYIIGYLVHKYWLGSPFLDANSISSIWLYMYGYSMYLFFDFAGYSKFAIGVSYLLGIRTPENFNKPFLSRNIKDFWNRWHMTLSFWFRDYVYMRFVYTAVKNKWLCNRYFISDIGLAVNFLIMGFWHGFLPQYIIYGLYHAAAFILFNKFERLNKAHHFWMKDNPWVHGLSVIITFHVICFGFLIFSGRLNFLW
ncbi:D-alanyl-lipoteichoic acid biosynthesis protein DltB [Sporolactobacillus shoreicorticis]|uniref:Teichoic acid D-alanyltransferase n=1 Tax=Sporolactobacillus shoreicorticis TaxID=1923877 RepID=A0ABW5S197_9BACL|nr:D-alanyl-lipoteichoic acid biosynthesis protein DltB [Sporolactobacillus shoreicorticis]MCO7124547.1 D-alanyl-lipoteichoic acid biosynthesis protein DltB [Sporolactobacillus shoreicorticis]